MLALFDSFHHASVKQISVSENSIRIRLLYIWSERLLYIWRLPFLILQDMVDPPDCFNTTPPEFADISLFTAEQLKEVPADRDADMGIENQHLRSQSDQPRKGTLLVRCFICISS